MTFWPLGAESETAKLAFDVPALPSVSDTSLMTIEGAASLSVIVPVPVGTVMSAVAGGCGFVRLTVNVSFASSSRSPTIGIVMF